MAQVSFTISAIDKTRAAFASINQGLRNLVSGGDHTEKKFISMGLKAAGLGSILAVVGSQVRKVAEDIRAVPGVNEDTIRAWDQLHARTSAVSDTLQNMVATAGLGLNSLANIIRFGFVEALYGADAAAQDLLDNEKELNEEYKVSSGYYLRAGEALDALVKARHELAAVDETDGQSIVRRRQEAAAMADKADSMTDEIQRTKMLTDSVVLQTGAERDYQKLLKTHRDLTADATNAELALKASKVSLTDRISVLEGALAEGNAALEKFNDLNDPQIVEMRNEFLKTNIKILGELKDAYTELDKRGAEAGKIISQGFEDAVFAGASLREMLRGIGQDLVRYIFNQTITQSLGGLIAGGVNSLLGGGHKLTTTASVLNGALAEGGQFGPGSYLVGENGPEIATFGSSGRMIPNNMIGGGGNTYVIDARGTDESVIQRLQAALLALAGPGVVERRAVGAVSDMRLRGAMA